ncbi:hypothetical protein HBB16_13850 [Pseudonocardia sp. MCCB 268]|nr:hypothetical protein [Pseudonocardia cytotoxica]
MANVHAQVERGKYWRVRLLGHPIDYTRFQMPRYRGRTFQQGRGPDPGSTLADHRRRRLTHQDFWMFDERIVVLQHFDDEGYSASPRPRTPPYVAIRRRAVELRPCRSTSTAGPGPAIGRARRDLSAGELTTLDQRRDPLSTKAPGGPPEGARQVVKLSAAAWGSPFGWSQSKTSKMENGHLRWSSPTSSAGSTRSEPTTMQRAEVLALARERRHPRAPVAPPDRPTPPPSRHPRSPRRRRDQRDRGLSVRGRS